MARDTDQELVRRVQKGDRRAFDLLFSRYQHKIHGLISRYVRGRDEIDDAGLVAAAQIVPPTSQNQASIEADLTALALAFICIASQMPVAMPQPTSSLPSRIERGCGLRLDQPNFSAPCR